MSTITSKEMYDRLVDSGASQERILGVMMRRDDRHREYYERSQDRLRKLKQEHRSLLIATGRLITVKVEHIAKDVWGVYTWYKNSMYRYEGEGIWKKYVNKNNEAPHYMAKHNHGIFTVNILLSEEDMPEVFIGQCIGTMRGEKLIGAKGHMIGHGDKFELRKIKNG